MDPARLAALLADITGHLALAPGTPPSRLARLKEELSGVLQTQPVEEITATASNLLDLLQKPSELSHLAALAGGTPFPPTVPPATAFRAFRREVPSITSQYAASVPVWAAGQHIDHTLGPFADRLGKRYWFDFYLPGAFVQVRRGSEIILLLPIEQALSVRPDYRLVTGSVWIQSRLLAPGAPAGAFTGLRIREGGLTIHALVTVADNAIVLGAADECELRLILDQPAAAFGADTAIGDDAENLTIRLPKEVGIRVAPGSATIVDASEMTMRVYGQDYRFRISGQPTSFEPLLNRILVPFDGSESRVNVRSAASTMFQLSGTARVLSNAWALPVTLAAIDRLGDAAGIGAIAIRTDPGLRTTWDGLGRGPARLEHTYLLTEPGQISITAAATSRRGAQRFELWNERNPAKKVRSVADIRYAAPFQLFYNASAGGSETTLLNAVELELRIDRPVTAAGERPRVAVPSAVVAMFDVKGERFVYLQGSGIIQQLAAAKRFAELIPVSYALTNAFLELSAVDRVDLGGQWTAPHRLDEGGVALFFRLSFLLPTLPDPYVSSFNPLSHERRAAERPDVTLTGIRQPGASVYFGALNIWTAPDKPVLSFAFLPQPAGNAAPILPASAAAPAPLAPIRGFSAGPSASGHNRAAEVMQEDRSSVAALREAFEFALPRLVADRDIRPDHIHLLDVSTTADLFGVGFPILTQRRASPLRLPFAVDEMNLVTVARLAQVYTLPQIQWEPVRTIQNPNVKPFPFPSPATPPDTGEPTLMETESYALVPIAPQPIISELIKAYNAPGGSKRIATLFSLPFGMLSTAAIDNPFDATKRGAQVGLNAPDFPEESVRGGIQIRIVATSPFTNPKAESPGFPGATIQLRNLLDLVTGTVPLDDEGKPLSVLGPVVDTVFNREFKPGGARPRVPVRRLDVSGYGATLFSEWLNPIAQIAATSQARFDVLIGRTAHEIIQIKSLLYPWAVPVVRTITIQRTPGGGVTRFDSGWKAQGPGEYDFAHFEYDAVTDTTTFHPNPYEVHPGVVRGVYNVTEIRDTGRIHRQADPDPLNDVEMQEVFFDCDVLVEDVRIGGVGGMVPSRRQRGFVQLAPYQKPLTPAQFQRLLIEEGNLGGPVNCVVGVGGSGQPMTVVRVEVGGIGGPSGPVFVAAASGGLHLPREGSWSVVKRGVGGPMLVGAVNQESGVPLIREAVLGAVATRPYRFADPQDLFNEANPATDYGLLHTTASEKSLYLRPTIARGGSTIESTLRPRFADTYALLDSLGLFPKIDTVFELGPGGTSLQILGEGRWRLNTPATLNVPPGVTRDLMNTGGSRIYVDYAAPGAGTSEIAVTFDSSAPVPWTATIRRHSIVMDLGSFKRILTVSADQISRYGEPTTLKDPKADLGSPLEPVVDLLRFLGGFDMAQAFDVSMGNSVEKSTQYKWKAGIKLLKVEFRAGALPITTIKVAGMKLRAPTPAEIARAEGLNPVPPLKIELEISLGAQYAMLPIRLTEDDVDVPEKKTKMLSVGGFFKFEGQLSILCFTLGAGVGVYFIGILGFEIETDNKEGGSVVYRVAVGLEVATELPVVGEVAVAMGIGIEYENSIKKKGHAFFVILFIKGEAELLGGLIAIAISLESKGGQRTEVEDGALKTYCVCIVEFAAEVSLAFVINIEFSVTWEEKKQLS